MTPLDFTYMDGHPVHRERTRAILAKHPEVRRLIGANPASALWILGLVTAQWLAAYLVRDLSWLWVLVAAYLCGAFIKIHVTLWGFIQCDHLYVYSFGNLYLII